MKRILLAMLLCAFAAEAGAGYWAPSFGSWFCSMFGCNVTPYPIIHNGASLPVNPWFVERACQALGWCKVTPYPKVVND